MTNRVIDHIVSKVIQHHHDSGTIKNGVINEQLADMLNLIDSIDLKSRGGSSEINEALGLIILNVIAICERNGTSIETCLNAAYDEIRG